MRPFSFHYGRSNNGITELFHTSGLKVIDVCGLTSRASKFRTYTRQLIIQHRCFNSRIYTASNEVGKWSQMVSRYKFGMRQLRFDIHLLKNTGKHQLRTAGNRAQIPKFCLPNTPLPVRQPETRDVIERSRNMLQCTRNSIKIPLQNVPFMVFQYLLTYLLTPWCRVLFEKLIVTQFVKK
jgi:hypothetical protein